MGRHLTTNGTVDDHQTRMIIAMEAPDLIVMLVDFPPERDCFIAFLVPLRVCLALPAVVVDAQQPREFTEEIRPQIWPIVNDV